MEALLTGSYWNSRLLSSTGSGRKLFGDTPIRLIGSSAPACSFRTREALEAINDQPQIPCSWVVVVNVFWPVTLVVIAAVAVGVYKKFGQVRMPVDRACPT